MEDILTLTFLVELPHDLGLPEGQAVMTLAERDPLLTDWSGDELGRFVLAQEPFREDLGPGTRLVFRRVQVNNAVFVLSAALAFRDWADAVLTEEQQANAAEDTARHRESGMDEWVTVAALMHYVPASLVVAGDGEVKQTWLREHFTQALAELNGVLTAVGLITGDWRFGPVPLDQISPLIPVIERWAFAGEDGKPRGTTRMVEVHGAFPNLADVKSGPEVLEAAVSLRTAANRDEQPFWPAFRLFFEAGRFGANARYAESILTLGTAMEVFTSTLLREGGQRKGWTRQRITEALDAGVAKKVWRYLADLFGIKIDLRTTDTPWGVWWVGGYGLRNQVAHDGRQPDGAELETAWQEAEGLYEHVRGLLDGDEDLKPLAELLIVNLRRTPNDESPTQPE